MSFISVPRPGPISAKVAGKGQPLASHAVRSQTATSSPNFRGCDEIAVAAEGLARGVVTGLGIEQADRHILVDRQRSCGRDKVDDSHGKGRHAATGRAPRLAVAIAQIPARTMGSESTMPIVSQPPNR